MEKQIPIFKKCTVCGKKIGTLRRMIAKRLDAKGNFHLTQKQFCSPRCANIGLKILSEIGMTRDDERKRFVKLIDAHISHINEMRNNYLNKYGGELSSIPPEIMARLYPGTVRILNTLKQELNDEKKTD